MAQFSAYRLAGNRLVLDLQADLIDTGSRVVSPLIPVAGGPEVIARLEPVFELHGEGLRSSHRRDGGDPHSAAQGAAGR